MRKGSAPLWLLTCAGLVGVGPLGAQTATSGDSAQAEQVRPATVDTEVAPPRSTRVSVSLEGGVSSISLGGQFGLTVSTPHGDIVARSTGASDFVLFGPSTSVEDVALLYGVRSDGRRGWVRAAAGPGWVRLVESGAPIQCAWFVCTYEQIESTGPGLALQLDAVWAPWRGFGFGASAGANLNGERTFGTLTVGVHFGQVR